VARRVTPLGGRLNPHNSYTEGKAAEPSDGSDMIGVLPGMGEDQSVMAAS
jgi:hypothetical protein